MSGYRYTFVFVCGFVVPEPAPMVSSLQTDRGEEMKRNIFPKAFIASLGLVLLLGSVSNSPAQVKQVEMHIAGYLCGN